MITPATGPSDRGSVLRSRGLPVLIGVQACLGALFAAVDLATIAFARHHGAAGQAALPQGDQRKFLAVISLAAQITPMTSGRTCGGRRSRTVSQLSPACPGGRPDCCTRLLGRAARAAARRPPAAASQPASSDGLATHITSFRGFLPMPRLAAHVTCQATSCDIWATRLDGQAPRWVKLNQFPESSRRIASMPYGRSAGGWMNSTPRSASAS